MPGAEMQRAECHTDLSATTLSAKGRSDISDWAGLHSKKTVNPPAGAGIQIDGYFPDDSTTNTTYGWNHDSQFVIRLPEKWNGQLVITGAPGVRKQYAPDYILSDWFLSQGYAYASTDKGNTGTSFYENGSRSAPGQAVREWHDRVSELTVAAKEVVAQRYGSGPARTWMTGISNGGYLTRWQLENRPELFDGGVDWEGTLFTADGPNLFTYLPTALREYPQAEVDPAARQRMYDVGFEPGSEILWPDHYAVYWDLTQRTYREAFDPGYDGATKAGTPFCRTGTAPGHADGLRRPVRLRLPPAGGEGRRRVGLADRQHPQADDHAAREPGRPAADQRRLRRLRADDRERRPRASIHRYYTIQDGNHVDDRHDLFPTEIRPILPCYREAFLRLTAWVTNGTKPPASQTVARPASGDVANTCPQLAASSSGGKPGKGNGGGRPR